MRVGIVCGYGNVLDGRLIQYLENVCAVTKRMDLSLLILSGGRSTVRSRDTEAYLMRQWLAQRLTIPLREESRALTSLHNLLYSKEVLTTLPARPEAVYVICDTARSLKMRILAGAVLGDYVTRIVVVHRKEHASVYWRQIYSIPVQLIGAFSSRIADGLERKKARSRDVP